jgi:hypothetical protein
MKIRNDFVSNSSSSSFIVATSNNNHTNNARNICSTLGYYSDETEDMFNNNTVLTLVHIDFVLNDEYNIHNKGKTVIHVQTMKTKYDIGFARYVPKNDFLIGSLIVTSTVSGVVVFTSSFAISILLISS